MTGLRLARLAGIALAATLSAPLFGAAPKAPDLEVSAPAFTFSRSSVTLEVVQHGDLAGRRLSVIVFVDQNMIRSFPTGGDRTRLVIDDLDLAPGSHDVLVKSGTFEARDRFRVVRLRVAAAVVAAAALIAAAIVALRRRRKA